jgi:hypothetical protein
MNALALERLPDWPAGMSRDVALAYTGVSAEQMKEWERVGRVRFRPRGPRGQMLALRSDLDTALRDLFGDAGAAGIDF